MAKIRLDEKTENLLSELAQGLAQEERYAEEQDTILSIYSVRECRSVVLAALTRHLTQDMSGREGWAYSEAVHKFFRSEYVKELKKERASVPCPSLQNLPSEASMRVHVSGDVEFKNH